MNDLLNEGLRHFSKGNFFAARDTWTSMENTCDDVILRCRVYNALGAVYDVLGEPSKGLEYLNHAHDLSRELSIDTELYLKIRANLAGLYGRTADWDREIELATEVLHYDREQKFPFYSVLSVTALMQAFIVKDLSHEAFKFEGIVNDLYEKHGTVVQEILFSHAYRNLGAASRNVGNLDMALVYYTKSHNFAPNQGGTIFVARTLYDMGRVDEAADLLHRMYLSVWDTYDWSEFALARTLELVGLLAAHETRFANRCFDKAELYIGQMSRWQDWTKLQEVRSLLPNVKSVPEMIDVDQWNHVLEDLTLLDSVSFMFPKLYRLAKFSVAIAERLLRTSGISLATDELRNYRVAGRLYLLGLTAMVATEKEAFEVLHVTEQHDEILELGIRLMSAYSHTKDYAEILRACTEVHRDEFDEKSRLVADCMSMALYYGIGSEVCELGHSQAVDWTIRVHKNVPSTVIDAFRFEMS